MYSKIEELLAPLIGYEKWLEANHEEFSDLRLTYMAAHHKQANAQTVAQADKWQDLRLKCADRMAEIREEMKETYEKTLAK
jgi:hypothetical protein